MVFILATFFYAMFALIAENVRNVPQSRAEQRNGDLFAPSLQSTINANIAFF